MFKNISTVTAVLLASIALIVSCAGDKRGNISEVNSQSDAWKTVSAYKAVKMNQIGYLPAEEKIVYSSAVSWKFLIRDTDSGEEVYSGTMRYMGPDDDTGMDIYTGDFTDFRDRGRYILEVAEVGESYPFSIAEGIYDEAVYLSSRFFYLQRSGTDIVFDDDEGTIIERGHTEGAKLWSDSSVIKDVSGGWYDAGDYGRYIPTAAFSVNQLLYAFALNPEIHADGTLNIPESGNRIPDLIDEIEWELSWMLKMQREDGAVYHKVTTRDYPEMGTAPSQDKQELFLFGPTSNDTAYFTAAMAGAARLIEPYDSYFAESCRKAALKSYTWLKENPGQYPAGGFHNPSNSKYPMQGGYDFFGSEDHSRMWAASEIYALTKNKNALDDFTDLFHKSRVVGSFQKMDWSDPYEMALNAYLEAAENRGSFYCEVLENFREQADCIVRISGFSQFHTSLKGRSGDFAYVWGSNQVVSANGLELLMAYKLFNDNKYLKTARYQLQYLLGSNGLSRIFLSGVGTNHPVNPHHNLSIHLGRTIPGIVTEGPNGASGEGSGGDQVLKKLWKAGIPAALCYADNSDSWATNEPTLDANASFTALISYFAGER